jgi:truncated hemoglobin YjbI
VQEEKRALEENWSINRLVEHWQRNRALRRALRRAEMTPEQFVAFAQVLTAALARGELGDDLDLDKVAARGELIVQRLSKDERVFSSLSDEGAHHVLQQAAWLPLLDTALHLRMIPNESRRLVAKHAERLRRIFPEEALRHPFEGMAQLLDESSLPFEELPESGSDDQITWSADTAILGTDPPPALSPTDDSGS